MSISNSQEINYNKQPKMFMFNLFVDIYKLIPDNNDNFQNKIKSCLTNLSIKAPEIVGESWQELFYTLQWKQYRQESVISEKLEMAQSRINVASSSAKTVPKSTCIRSTLLPRVETISTPIANEIK